MSSLSKNILGAALAAGLLLAGCGAGSQTPTDQAQGANPGAQPGESGAASGETNADAQEPVALVNGEPITRQAYERELARFEAGQAALGYTVADQNGYRQQVLNQMVEDVLFEQLAAERGITITDEEADAQINDMIAEYGQDYVDNWLEMNYYTREEFRDELRVSMLVQQLLPSDEELVPATAEQVHARHILVTSQGEAENVLTRLNNGEDFAAVAAEVSTDVTTRDSGGDLGWFPRGGLLVPEVEEAAFSLEPGQTSGVVPSAWGYHIVQTLEVDPNREVQPEIRQQLKQKAIEDWLAQIRNAADIQQLVDLSS